MCACMCEGDVCSVCVCVGGCDVCLCVHVMCGVGAYIVYGVVCVCVHVIQRGLVVVLL